MTIDSVKVPASVSVTASEQVSVRTIVRLSAKLIVSPIIVRGPPVQSLEQPRPQEMPGDEVVVLMKHSGNPIGTTGIVEGQLLTAIDEVAVQPPSMEGGVVGGNGFLDSLPPCRVHAFERPAAARRIKT